MIFCGVEEGGDWKVNFLMNVSVYKSWREGIATCAVDESVWREIHVFMNTTPLSCDRMITDKTVEDVVLARGNHRNRRAVDEG